MEVPQVDYALSQFNMEYKPRGALKGQALADFILVFPPYSKDDTWALIVIPGVGAPPWSEEEQRPLVEPLCWRGR